jgi:hypothetical protein
LKWSRRGGVIEYIVVIERSNLNGLRYLAQGEGDIYLCLEDINFWSITAYTDGRARVIPAWASAGRNTLSRKI